MDRNVLVVLTHKYTDAFIERLIWTRELWESLHPSNKFIVIVDVSKGVETQKKIHSHGIYTVGYTDTLVESDLGRAQNGNLITTERNSIKFRGFDMILFYMKYHDYKHLWYIENDVKYDRGSLRDLWREHNKLNDEFITWSVGGRGKNWWAWKRDTSKNNEWDHAKTPKRRVVSGEELEGSLGKVSGRTVGLHSHHPLVVWTRSELVALVEKPANQKRRITAGRERARTETAVCPVPLVF